MKKLLLQIPFFIVSLLIVNGQEDPAGRGLKAINEGVLKAQLGFLASDWMEGRDTGEKGEYLASDYIASMLQLYGVKPGGDYPQARLSSSFRKVIERSYFQNFILLKTVPGEEQILRVTSTEGMTNKTKNFDYNVDFITRSTGSITEVEAPVIFAGYGFKNDKIKHNDFSKVDVKGKFILRISGNPRFVTESLSASEIIVSMRETEAMLREAGAAGIIEFNPAMKVVGSPARPGFLNLSPAEGNPRSGIAYTTFSIPGEKYPDNLPRIIVSVKAANEILKGTGISWEDYQKKADSNQSFNIPAIKGKTMFYKSEIKTSQIAVRNVIGIIEGHDPEQVIVLGAHYDHLGIHNGFIWNGADDNASGTVGILTLAKALMETGVKPEKTIIVALWTAEEEGLLGSRYYVQNLTYPLQNLRMNLNFDMISRYISDDDQKKVIMTYTSSHPHFKDLTENNLKKYGIDLIIEYQPSDNPPGGSDHRSFVAAGVPVMRFKPGHREEYHTPGDETNTVEWDIMEKIVRLSFLNIWELANSEW